MFEKLIYLYILLLPLMKLPKLAFMGNKMQYADLLFIPLFLLYLFRLFKGKFKFIRNKTDLFFILLIVVSSLSFLCASAQKEIFLDFVGLIYLVCLYFVFSNLINEKNKINKISLFLFIITSFISISGILFFILFNIFGMEKVLPFLFLGGSKSSLVSFARISSFLTMPEMFINFILLGLSSAFIYRNSVLKAGKKRLVDFCIGLIILSAFLAFSRSLAGLMLFLTLITFYFSKKSFKLRLLRIVCFHVFILLLSFAVITSVFTIYPISLSKNNTTGITHLSFNSNLDTRVYLTKAALTISRKHPLLGLGLGSFTNCFKNFLTKEEIGQLSTLRVDPHSLYFGALSEIGYLGIIVLLFIFFLIPARLIKAYKVMDKDSYLKNSCYVFLSAFFAYLLNGFFVDILSMRSFWVLMSMAIVISNLAEQEIKNKK